MISKVPKMAILEVPKTSGMCSWLNTFIRNWRFQRGKGMEGNCRYDCVLYVWDKYPIGCEHGDMTESVQADPRLEMKSSREGSPFPCLELETGWWGRKLERKVDLAHSICWAHTCVENSEVFHTLPSTEEGNRISVSHSNQQRLNSAQHEGQRSS